MDLDKNILETFIDEVTGDVVGPEDGTLNPYKFSSQYEDLSESLGGAKTTQKFFDFMPFKVFLPWIRALTYALNALKGKTKTSLEDLEKNTADSILRLECKVGQGYDAIDKRVQMIERDVIIPAEQAAANAQNAADLAGAAAENVMKKDQVASVLDVVKKTPIYFGTGSDEDIGNLPLEFGENALIFDKNDTAWNDLVADVETNSENIANIGNAVVENLHNINSNS